MAYNLNLVQINASAGGFGISLGNMGFPTGNFRTLLYSQWVCGPTSIAPQNPANFASVNTAFTGLFWFGFGPDTHSSNLSFEAAGGGAFYTSTFPTTAYNGVRSHMLMSVDTQANIVQAYINDAPVALVGSWTGAVGSNWFNIEPVASQWRWDVSNTFASTYQPAVGDIWCASPPAFVDLSIVANRRKFINADLTPVALGANGSTPFGYQPQIYCTMQDGGAPTDILHNLGTGGGTFSYAGSAPTTQTPGVCTLPPPPPAPPPPASGLQMEQMFATFPVYEECKIFLEWSDDRGHSWSNPVGQHFGGVGEYIKSLQWQRLGYARDRVFQIEWSCSKPTALQGAWIEVTPAQS